MCSTVICCQQYICHHLHQDILYICENYQLLVVTLSKIISNFISHITSNWQIQVTIQFKSYTNNRKRPSVYATEVRALYRHLSCPYKARTSVAQTDGRFRLLVYGHLSCSWLRVVCTWCQGGKWAWQARRGRCTLSSWAQQAVRVNWGLYTTVQPLFKCLTQFDLNEKIMQFNFKITKCSDFLFFTIIRIR